MSQSNSNGTKLALMPLPLPPVAEQKEIVRRVAAVRSRHRVLADRVRRAARSTARRVPAVLGRLLRGEAAIPTEDVDGVG